MASVKGTEQTYFGRCANLPKDVKEKKYWIVAVKVALCATVIFPILILLGWLIEKAVRACLATTTEKEGDINSDWKTRYSNQLFSNLSTISNAEERTQLEEAVQKECATIEAGKGNKVSQLKGLYDAISEKYESTILHCYTEEEQSALRITFVRAYHSIWRVQIRILDLEGEAKTYSCIALLIKRLQTDQAFELTHLALAGFIADLETLAEQSLGDNEGESLNGIIFDMLKVINKFKDCDTLSATDEQKAAFKEQRAALQRYYDEIHAED